MADGIGNGQISQNGVNNLNTFRALRCCPFNALQIPECGPQISCNMIPTTITMVCYDDKKRHDELIDSKTLYDAVFNRDEKAMDFFQRRCPKSVWAMNYLVANWPNWFHQEASKNREDICSIFDQIKSTHDGHIYKSLQTICFNMGSIDILAPNWKSNLKPVQDDPPPFLKDFELGRFPIIQSRKDTTHGTKIRSAIQCQSAVRFMYFMFEEVKKHSGGKLPASFDPIWNKINSANFGVEMGDVYGTLTSFMRLVCIAL